MKGLLKHSGPAPAGPDANPKAFPGRALKSLRPARGRWGGMVQSKDLVVQSKDLVVQSKDLVVYSTGVFFCE